MFVVNKTPQKLQNTCVLVTSHNSRELIGVPVHYAVN